VKAPVTPLQSLTSGNISHSGTATGKHSIREDALNHAETKNLYVLLTQNP
jgi:hypothetical protein